MAGNATLTLLGLITNFRGGLKTLSPPPITSGTSPATNTVVNLAVGANPITVPPLSVGAVIVPPSGNVVSLTIGGVRLHNTNWHVQSLDSSVGSFTITAGGTINNVEIWFF